MSLAALLTDTVTVAPRTGVTAAGDPSFGVQSTLPARVEHGQKLVYGSDGSEVQSEAVIVTAAEIPHGSLVWLPGASVADTNAAKRPITTRRASTPGGGLTVYETYL